ncbi:MAG TPA: trypsin-like serine protease [Tichowtungia sp.]|nr:trypsin-like serine protease [Tichowtungia sp.]
MKSLSVIALLFILASIAPAIVVEDNLTAASPPFGDWDLNWDYVYNYRNSSAVAVGEYWLLTAAHVADDGGTGALTINGTTYLQQEIIVHAGTADPDNADNADLALVRYDKPLSGFYDLYAGSFTTASELILVGFGNTGAVFTASSGPGPPGPPVPDYYTDSGSGRGIRRWGTQDYNGGGTGSFTIDSLTTTNEVFAMRFVVGETPYEAGVGIGDSGGGSFIKDGDEWKLAGTIISRNGNAEETEFDFSISVSVPAYTNWVLETMDSVTGDLDSDGIPNWWEEQFGTNIVEDADQDGDGFDGEQEYIADTDPTDGSSFFRIDGLMTAAQQTVTFDGSTARQYQLLTATNDLASTNFTWIDAGEPIWGEGPGTQITATNVEQKVFYRLEAILP